MVQRAFALSCLALVLSPSLAIAEEPNTRTLSGLFMGDPVTCVLDLTTREVQINWRQRTLIGVSETFFVGAPILKFKLEPVAETSGAAGRLRALEGKGPEVESLPTIKLGIFQHNEPMTGQFIVEGRLRGRISELIPTLGERASSLWRAATRWLNSTPDTEPTNQALGQEALPSVSAAKAALAAGTTDAAFSEALANWAASAQQGSPKTPRGSCHIARYRT